MRSTTILSLVAALVLTLSGGAAAAVDDTAIPEAGRAILGSHPLCDVELDVTDNARFFTGFAPDPAWPFNLAAGLWVGALVDHGSGPEPFVSSGLFDFEFFSVDNPPLARPGDADLLVDGFRAVMRDTYTPDFSPDHTPLGLEVVQDSYVMQTIGDIGWVDVRYTVENISDEVDGRGLGWDLENVYLGILADPDVGVEGSGFQFWSDDLGGFAPGPLSTQADVAPGAVRGDLAYMFDEPGNGDDTDVQVGIALRGRPAHRFAIWSGGAEDPMTDAERYARLRGNSDEEPTIDPPPTRADDYRILVAVGPIARLSPGEKTGFAVSFACGDLGPTSTARPPSVSVGVARAPDLVVKSGATAVRLGAESPVEIWSVAGRRVATVPAGTDWDLRVQGSRVPAGVYFYRPVDGSAPAARIVVLR